MRMSLRPASLRPRRSKRPRISPIRPRWTPSGLTMMSVRSNGVLLDVIDMVPFARMAGGCVVALRSRLVAAGALGEAEAGVAALHANAPHVSEGRRADDDQQIAGVADLDGAARHLVDRVAHVAHAELVNVAHDGVVAGGGHRGEELFVLTLHRAGDDQAVFADEQRARHALDVQQSLQDGLHVTSSPPMGSWPIFVSLHARW